MKHNILVNERPQVLFASSAEGDSFLVINPETAKGQWFYLIKQHQEGKKQLWSLVTCDSWDRRALGEVVDLRYLRRIHKLAEKRGHILQLTEIANLISKQEYYIG